MKVRDYINLSFESSCYRTAQYATFERACKRELKAQCAERGINIHSFSSGHYEWSAVLERGGKYVYVSLSDVRYWNWYNRVLIRTMSHATDWTGGSNNYCHFGEIGEYAEGLFKRMD